jgi:hypothetical protein
MGKLLDCVKKSKILLDYAKSSGTQIVVRSDILDADDVKIESSNVIYFFEDIMGLEEYDFMIPKSSRKDMLDRIVSFTSKYPETNFTFFATVVNDVDIQMQNFSIKSSIDECWVQDHADFKSLVPVTEKDFSLTDHHYVFLNHSRRFHRILGCAYILGKNLESSGYISLDPALFTEHQSWDDFINYTKYNDRSDLFTEFNQYKNIFSDGFDKITNSTGYKKENVFDRSNDFFSINRKIVENFSKYLTQIYKSSCIEIVGETIFFGNLGTVTEKYLHTIFGCNFPILLNVPGTINHLRNQGFDMFDDVIDHRYDLELNHAKRIARAIDDNQHILTDKQYAVDQWFKCQDRFKRNIDHALELDSTTQQRFDKSMAKNLGI